MEASNKLAEEEYADSSSESILADEWQELSKSDYAKVIFCDLYYNPISRSVECKFQITDNVHEDPCDFVGLYRIGYDNLSQCLVSKMLCQTNCEDDGKLQRCIFKRDELPHLDDGFYQFLYVTRDKEVCGASMPFEIKQLRTKNESANDIVADRIDGDFLLVRHGIEKRNEMLEESLDKYRKRNQEMSLEVNKKDKKILEKQDTIACLQNQIEVLKAQALDTQLEMCERLSAIDSLRQEVESYEKANAKLQDDIKDVNEMSDIHREEIAKLNRELRRLRLCNRRLEAEASTEQDSQILAEQFEDQKFMIKALEDSKQLAMKEMADLSESLSKRTHILNQLRCELASCKGKLNEAKTSEEKQTAEVKKLQKEVKDLIQILGEKEDTLTMKSLRIEDLEKKVERLMGEQKASVLTKSEETMTSDLEKSNAHGNSISLLDKTAAAIEVLHSFINELVFATDFTSEPEACRFFEIKIQLLVMLSKMRKPDKNDLKLARTADSVVQRIEPEKKYAAFLPLHATGIANPPSLVAVSESGIGSEESLSNQEQTLQNAPHNELEKVLVKISTLEEDELLSTNMAEQAQKIRLQMINEINSADIPNLDAEDIALVNRLAERIAKREPGFLLPAEMMLEDSVSEADSESDSSENVERGSQSKTYTIKKDLLCLDRIEAALREHLQTTNNLSSVIEGYDKAYAALPAGKRAHMLLEECKKEYQTEILAEYIEKQKENMKKVSERICELLTRCMMWKDDVVELKAERDALQLSLTQKEAERDALQLSLTQKEAELQKLSEDCGKKDAIISFWSTERLNFLKKEVAYHEAISEHSARITAAADLYRKQFMEIEKLKKKLKKCTTRLSKASISSKDGNTSESGKYSSFEVVKGSPRNISDSDTGEHVLANAVAAQNEGMMLLEGVKPLGARPKDSLNSQVDESNFSKITSVSCDNVPSFTHKDFFKWILETQPYYPITQSAKMPIEASLENAHSFSVNVPVEVTVAEPTLSSVVSDSKFEASVKNATHPTVNVPAEMAIAESTPSSVVSDVQSEASVKQSTPPLSLLPGTTVAGSAFSPVVKDIKSLQKIITEKFTFFVKSSEKLKKIPQKQNDSETSDYINIPCILCNEEFSISAQSTIELINHLEKVHQISMCPICGQLFEAAVPKKYLIYHVEDHFQSD